VTLAHREAQPNPAAARPGPADHGRGRGHATTEAGENARLTQENGARPGDGPGGSPSAAGYFEADLEPIRARLTALARGDFRPCREPADDRHPAAPAAGPVLAEVGQLVDELGSQLASLASEVAQMAGQVRNIAQVTSAVANGDLSKKIDIDAR